MTEHPSTPDTRLPDTGAADTDAPAAAAAERGCATAGAAADSRADESVPAGAERSAAPATAPQVAAAARRAIWPGFGLALVIALFAAGATWAWTEARSTQTRLDATQQSIAELRQTLTQRAEAVDTAAAELTRSRDELQQQFAAQVRELTERLASQQGQIEQVLARVRALGPGAERDWLLLEAEHQARIAADRLRWQHDPHGAAEVLRLAAEQLTRSGLAAAQPLIAEARGHADRLAQSPLPDRTALAAELAALAQQVPDWPLPQPAQMPEDTAAAPADGELAAALRGIRQSFESLVKVRAVRPGTAPVTAPQERYFLVQNLLLQIEAAELGLATWNAALYRRSLAQAERWVQDYFVADGSGAAAQPAPAIAQGLARIRRLQAVAWPEPLPALDQLAPAIAALREPNP